MHPVEHSSISTNCIGPDIGPHNKRVIFLAHPGPSSVWIKGANKTLMAVMAITGIELKTLEIKISVLYLCVTDVHICNYKKYREIVIFYNLEICSCL